MDGHTFLATVDMRLAAASGATPPAERSRANVSIAGMLPAGVTMVDECDPVGNFIMGIPTPSSMHSGRPPDPDRVADAKDRLLMGDRSAYMVRRVM